MAKLPCREWHNARVKVGTLYIYLVSSFRLAARELWRHGIRSFLTILGVTIGVAAVVSIAGLGQGLKDFFAMSIGSSSATDVVYVMPNVPFSFSRLTRSGRPFKTRDVELVKASPYVARVIGGDFQEDALVKHGWRTDRVMVANVDIGYFALDRLEPGRGRLFSEAEIHYSAPVAVLGGEVAANLYDPEEAVLGSKLLINGVRFTVVGELRSVSAIEGGFHENKAIYIPLPTGQHRLFGRDDLYWMAVQVKDSEQILAAKEDIAQRLRVSRHIRSTRDDDFLLMATADFASFVNRYINTFTAVLAVVAGIALVIGGVGVMNIMLVSVTERTHEIGLRKAAGATRGEIVWQFLIEALALTTLGGLLGVCAGLALANLVGYVLEATVQVSWDAHVPLDWVAIVYAASLLIGVLFGVYPAARAAALDPIQALHA